MAEAAILHRSWRVGQWTATLTVPPLSKGSVRSISVDWTPFLPDRALTPGELKQYRSGRDAALSDLTQELGINLAVIDL